MTMMDRLARDGRMPYSVVVQTKAKGEKWREAASGDRVSWLREVAIDEAAKHGKSRIVSPDGTVLEKYKG